MPKLEPNRDDVLRMLTASAREMVDGDSRPYDVAMRLLGDLGAVLEADCAGDAYFVWGFLTDGIDGPPSYARGLTGPEIEDLMRQAAAEWLALDPTADNLDAYFERWSDWPDTLLSKT